MYIKNIFNKCILKWTNNQIDTTNNIFFYITNINNINETMWKIFWYQN
jgi:hypothetical protein